MPHFETHTIELLEMVKVVCSRIENRNGKKFNPWAFVQKWSNNKGHPQAILEALQAIDRYWFKIKNPWIYGNKIMKVASGNYYESEHVTESEKFKEIIELNPDLKSLTDGMLKSV